MDTIFALATVPGKSGVAVIRVSGPRAVDCCKILGFDAPPARQAAVRKLVHAELGFLDEALVLVFEDGASFTGEPVVELQTHGSVAIIQALLRGLSEIEGFRAAEPGEFTRRALERGRLDLTQVEALSDLIDSETESQRRQAMAGFSGKLKDSAELWRGKLLKALSLLEATIDFADEEVPENVTDDVQQLLEQAAESILSEIDGYGVAERIRSGFEVAIVGPPNIGKSTLLNALAGRDAALTSEVAGTTRDVIEVRMDLGGLAVTFLDTAGLRETPDEIEALGVERAVERANSADLRIFLVDDVEVTRLKTREGDIVVFGKSDLRSDDEGVSGLTGEGVSNLVDAVRSQLIQRASGAGLVVHQRQRDVLCAGHESLRKATMLVSRGQESYDLVAEEVRHAIFALERLIGRVDVEDVLGEIFSNFCIGK